ncbi:MAG: hypothetical protein R3323_03100 [Wenzhouxiangellaceae bacterium]|nr:hypothetical protein [Wenzhouxiangellaceae bacterium]
MKLVRLTIRTLPGLPRGIELAPDPDRVCVVLGPNASGKTSLLRALGLLLEPNPRSQPIDIEAEFADGETRVRGHALGPTRTWRIDGREVERPDWPGPGPLAAYLVRADELAVAGEPETEFAATLKRAMAGGFDLDALADSPEFALPPRPRKLARSVSDAEQALERLEREQARLADEVDALDDLRLQRDASIEAARKLDLVHRASELLRVERGVDSLRDALAAFPEGMEHLDGSEGERLAQIDEDRTRLEHDLQDRRRDREQAFEASAAIGIDDIDAATAFSAEIAERRQSLEGDERRLAELGQRIAALEDDERTAAERAGGRPDAARTSLVPERLAALERAAERWSAARAECEQLERSRARHAEQAPDGDALAATDSAVRSLRTWLRASAPTPAAWIVWSLLLAAAAAGSAWLELAQGLRWPAIAVASAGLLPLVQLALMTIRSLAGRRSRRHYPAYAVEPPQRWRLPEVVRRLDELERKLSTLQRQQAEAERARDLGLQIAEARERVNTARKGVEAAADAAGLVAEEVLDTSGRLRLQALSDWRNAGDRLHAARREAAACQRALSEQRQGLEERFERSGHAAPDEWAAEALGGWRVRFDQLVDKARAARERSRAAEKAIERIEQSLHDLDLRRRKLLAKVGVEDADALTDRIRRHADYRERFDELRAEDRRRQALREQLDGYPDLLARVDARDESALRDLESELEARAGDRDELGERIATIETERRSAISERRLEALNSELERLRSELDRTRRDRMDAEAAQLLIERARTGHDLENQPKLLRRAARHFGRMTRSRFTLRFDGSEFGADDARTGLSLNLAELSTATRIQLLLALRLAWIERNERRGADLPLFLDEVLATTDPERYRAVVEAVQELVREGRQVIYLSSQPADADAWRRFAGEPAPQVVELAPMGEADFEFTVPDARALPDPDLAPGDWARRAGVAAIEPWDGTDAVPLFHILRDDLESVVDLAGRGIETLGQYEHARSIDLGLPIDEDRARVVDRRAAAARGWIECWRRGHAPPVEIADLQESGAITPTFFEAVSELNRTLGGNGAALIEALRDGEIKRFQTAKIEQLEDFLANHGFLATDRGRSTAERRAALIESGDLDDAEAERLDTWLRAGIRSSGED